MKRSELCPCDSGKAFNDCHNNPELASELESKPIRNQALWSIVYRKDRYLEHASDDELFERTEDIISNMTVLKHFPNQGLKIGLHPLETEGKEWMFLWNAVLEEWLLRDYIYPEPFKSRNLDREKSLKLDWPGLKESGQKIEEKRSKNGAILVKYGQRRFLSQMIEKGAIRISPASFYDDSSLNFAIKDDELRSTIFAKGSDMQFQAVDEKTLKPKSGFFSPIGKVEVSFKARTNYYVYCLAYDLSYRMFGDFEADCCVIINNPKAFLARLSQAFHQQLPDYQIQAGLISYFDPFKATASQIKTGFSKHFKYAYQREYRVLWEPKISEGKLEPIFVELGNLEDCCELLLL